MNAEDTRACATTPNPSGRVRASGKAILVGEHFVVYGARALALRMPQGVEIAWAQSDVHQLNIDAWGVSFVPTQDADAPELARAYGALLAALPGALRERLPAIHLHATMEIPSGAGLGSSAALGVAVLRAFEEAAGYTLTETTRFEIVFAWERVFHGNPSGFDHATSLCEGLTVFSPGERPPFATRRLAHPLSLILALVEPGASTARMVDGVRQWRDQSPAQFEVLMARANTRAHALEALLTDADRAYDLAQIGAILNENHLDLQAIGVSTPALDDACAQARSSGAFGAKLIGAGGGGCILALTDTQTQPRVIEALSRCTQATYALHVTP